MPLPGSPNSGPSFQLGHTLLRMSGSRKLDGVVARRIRQARCWVRWFVGGARGRLRRVWQRDQPYEPELVGIASRLLRAGAVAVDVGANVGNVTLHLAVAVGPEGRVVAFEPHPANVAELARKVRRQRLSWVTIEQVAVTNGSTETVMLYSGRGSAGAEWNIGGRTVSGEPGLPELEVKATSLDAYFLGCDRLDLVKIDVEGAEGAVLDGMRDLVARTRPIVIIEFHDDANWGRRSTLVDLNYTLFDTAGRRLRRDAVREYHAVALPTERSDDLSVVAWPDLASPG
jgi:FkbM family methyltransferase